MAGLDAWVVEGTANPAFRPDNSDTKLLTKFRGKLWIAKSNYEWVKMEVESTENISFGWLVARLNKGAVLRLEQTRVNNEIWMPERIQIHFDAKLALVRNMRREVKTHFHRLQEVSVEFAYRSNVRVT